MAYEEVLRWLRQQLGPDRPPPRADALERMRQAGLEPKHVGWAQWLRWTRRIRDDRQ